MAKTCTKCGEEKSLEDFHKNKSRKDGLYFYCKACRREYYQKNKEAITQYQREYYQKNPHVKKKWEKKNKAKINRKTSVRRARKRRAMPDWLTPEHLAEIELAYDHAQQLTELTGVQYHVDHIVPLKGKGVRGLHVPWNLQVITAKENLSKHNKYDDWREYG